MADRQLPTGVVTFFFSDLEGSTTMARALGEAWPDVLARHHTMVRDAITAHGGVEVKTAGDGFFVAFESPDAAVHAATALQRAVAADTAEPRVAVRIGLHTGSAVVAHDDYVGLAVHQAARVAGVAAGGQVLATDAVRQLTSAAPMVELGSFAIKDFGDLRLHEVVWEEGRSTAAPRAESADRVQLPVPASPLVGREVELDEVLGMLRDHRVVTLTGMGGAGKTRLAVEAARHAASTSHPAGAWFVDLTTASSDDQVAGIAASALGIIGATKPAEALLSGLGKRPVLLVLDNCEQVIEGAASLAASIVAATGASVLATSRESLAIGAEATYAVPPLVEAVDLFCARANQVRGGFAVTESERAVVAEICDRLDGLPLGIELAASLTQSLTVDQIAARLDDRFGLLQSRTRDRAARQRTLWAAVDWSYQLLEDEERAVLRRLAVFVGGFSLDAAEAVVADELVAESGVVHIIDRLVSKSLVVPDPKRLVPGFRLLETIREHALERLVEAGEEQATRQRHLTWAAALAVDARNQMLGPDDFRAVVLLEAETPNIRSGIEWGFEHDPQRALQALGRFLDYMGTRPDPAGSLRLAETGLAVDAGSPTVRAIIHAAACYLGHPMGDAEVTRRHAEAVLALVGEDPTDPDAVWAAGWAMVSLGCLDGMAGRLPEAEERLRRVLTLEGPPDVFAAHSRALQNLGSFLVLAGRVDEGIELMEAGIEMIRSRGLSIGRCYLLETLASRQLGQGRLPDAISSLEEAVVTSEQVREWRVLSRCALALASLLAALHGDEQRVQSLANRALTVARASNQVDLLCGAIRSQLAAIRASVPTLGTVEPGLRAIPVVAAVAAQADDPELVAEIEELERELRSHV